jgi:hypothetical protein
MKIMKTDTDFSLDGTMRGTREAINQSPQKKIKYDKLNLMSHVVVCMYTPDEEEVNYVTNFLNLFAIIHVST